MLNLELIDNLYAGLPREKQQELIGLLFKRSKQTMAYFRRTKDISLSKLEILADFFHMPLDYFRANSSFKSNNVSGNNNYVGNVSMGTNLLIENDALRKEISLLKDRLQDKETLIKTQGAYIKVLEERVDQNKDKDKDKDKDKEKQ